MEFWPVLSEIGLLLGAAFAMGAICERLRQSALLGYLLAGMLLGPNAFHVVSAGEGMEGFAEIGVALLLFCLGLEFSWRRLQKLGMAALGGGFLQVVLSLLAVAGICILVGLPPPTAFVIGGAFSLSSTAGVLRMLMARSEIDSVHGRHALGILLFQDLAVIPLVLVTGVLANPTTDSTALSSILHSGLMLLLMIVGFYLVFSHIVPRVFLVTATLRNRELPVLFSLVAALGSIFVAHSLSLSPAVGAFIAGMLLGESPFANQVRADLSLLRTLLVTVFFCSVGMLADPLWIRDNIVLTLAVVSTVIIVKTMVTAISLRAVGKSISSALAAGICLAQVGEFAFVIAGAARGTLIDDQLFMVIVSTMMVTLFLTPYLVGSAPLLSRSLLRPLRRLIKMTDPSPGSDGVSGHVVLVGFGPAGEECSDALQSKSYDVSVLDLNPSLVAKAKASGLDAHVGDSTHPDVLAHLNINTANAVIVTLPDPGSVERTVRAIRSCSEDIPVIVRSRYHKHIGSLESAGASAVVDEEREVGELLGKRTHRFV